MTLCPSTSRSPRIAVGDVRVVDRVAASRASLLRLGSDGTVMKRHDDSQRSGRLAVTFGELRVVDSAPRPRYHAWPGVDGCR